MDLKGGRDPDPTAPPAPRKIQTSWTNIIKLPNLSLRSPLANSNIPWSPWKKFWTRAYYGIKLFIFITVATKRRNNNNCSNGSKVLFQENSVNSWSRDLQLCWFTALEYDCIFFAKTLLINDMQFFKKNNLPKKCRGRPAWSMLKITAYQMYLHKLRWP